MDWLEDRIDRFKRDTRKERREKEKEKEKKRNEFEELMKNQKEIEDRFKERLQSTIFPILEKFRKIVKENGFPCTLEPYEENKLKNTVVLSVEREKKSKVSKRYQVSFILEPSEFNVKLSMSFEDGLPENESLNINDITEELVEEKLHSFFKKVFPTS